MAGWDYVVLTVTVDNSNPKAPKYEAVAVHNGRKLFHHKERGQVDYSKPLAELGRAGWDLVAPVVLPVPYGGPMSFFLKRPLPETRR